MLISLLTLLLPLMLKLLYKLIRPPLQILTLTLIFTVYYEDLFKFSPFIFICCFISTISTIYIVLYRWRKIEVSVNSFFFFYINVNTFVLYLFTIKFSISITCNNLWDHVFLIELIPFCIFFIISLITRPLRLNQEIIPLLHTWSDNNAFIYSSIVNIIHLVALSPLFRTMFFLIHFLLFHTIRLINITLLYWIMYNANLFYFTYVTLLMFFFWLLSLVDLYLISFLDVSLNYIRSLILVTIPGNKERGIIRLKHSGLSIKLTQKALSLGFTDNDKDILTDYWCIQEDASSYFKLYTKITNYFNFFVLLFISTFLFYKLYWVL